MNGLSKACLLFLMVTIILGFEAARPRHDAPILAFVFGDNPDQMILTIAADANLDLVDRGRLPGSFILTQRPAQDDQNTIRRLYDSGVDLALAAQPGFGCASDTTALTAKTLHPFSRLKTIQRIS